MRKSCLKPDKELIEELCNKYGEDVRNAVTDAIISKNEDFQKAHKPICDIEDFILQLEGNWCDLFIEALRDECNQILEDSNRKKETLLQKNQSVEPSKQQIEYAPNL